jgi:pSer/pThr/pTyr-binding forkhead associated (FHA) protein
VEKKKQAVQVKTMDDEQNALPAPGLIVTTKQGSVEFPLEKETITIGRSAKNDIVIDDLVVSRSHAEIRHTPEGYVIKDLGSTNGLFSGSGFVSEKLLVDGDVLWIADSVSLTYRAPVKSDGLAVTPVKVGETIPPVTEMPLPVDVATPAPVVQPHEIAPVVAEQGVHKVKSGFSLKAALSASGIAALAVGVVMLLSVAVLPWVSFAGDTSTMLFVHGGLAAVYLIVALSYAGITFFTGGKTRALIHMIVSAVALLLLLITILTVMQRIASTSQSIADVAGMGFWIFLVVAVAGMVVGMLELSGEKN